MMAACAADQGNVIVTPDKLAVIMDAYEKFFDTLVCVSNCRKKWDGVAEGGGYGGGGAVQTNIVRNPTFTVEDVRYFHELFQRGKFISSDKDVRNFAMWLHAEVRVIMHSPDVRWAFEQVMDTQDISKLANIRPSHNVRMHAITDSVYNYPRLFHFDVIACKLNLAVWLLRAMYRFFQEVWDFLSTSKQRESETGSSVQFFQTHFAVLESDIHAWFVKHKDGIYLRAKQGEDVLERKIQ